MKIVVAMGALGAFILLCGGGLAVTGVGAGGAAGSEVVPVSVRSNPGSYRPTYAGQSGYSPVPVSTSSGGYSSGGYSSGK